MGKLVMLILIAAATPSAVAVHAQSTLAAQPVVRYYFGDKPPKKP